MRRAVAVAVVVALLILCLGGLGAAGAGPHGNQGQGQGHEKGFKFKDMDQAPWAYRNVLKWSLREVIRGRSEDEFAPNSPVKQGEAIAMVLRVLGYEDEAVAAAEEIAEGLEGLPLPDSSLFPEWTVGYLAVALDLGFLDAGERFQPEKPADRSWTTWLVAAGLGWDEEELDDYLGASPDFPDLKNLPPELLACLAYAMDQGLVVGYPDHTFQPNKPVTRAEMAALIDRLSGELGPDEDQIEGRVQEVLIGEGDLPSYITIRTADHRRVAVELAPDAAVFIDDAEADLEDVEEGSWALVSLEAGLGVLVEVQTRYEVEGVVKAITTGTGGSMTLTEGEGDDAVDNTYPLADDVTVRFRGDEVELDVVVVGAYVEALLEGGEVVRITIEELGEEEEYEGEVTDLDVEGLQLTIETEEDGTLTFDVSPEVEVYYKDQGDLGLDQVQVGDQVEIRVEGGEEAALVVRIRIEEREEAEVEGSVVAVDAVERTLSVEDEDGVAWEFPVADDATIQYEGDDITLAEVLVGDEVEVKVEGGEAVEVIVEERGEEEEEVEGSVVAVDAVERTLSVEDEDGVTWELPVADDATIQYEGDDITLAEVLVGDEVEVKVEGGEAVEVTVEERGEEEALEYEGQVTAVDPLERLLHVEDEDGVAWEFPVADEATIHYEGDDITLAEVLVGDWVEVTVLGGEAVEVTVEERGE